MSGAELVIPDSWDDSLQQVDDDIANWLVQAEMEGTGKSDNDVPLPDAKEKLRAVALIKVHLRGNWRRKWCLI